MRANIKSGTMPLAGGGSSRVTASISPSWLQFPQVGLRRAPLAAARFKVKTGYKKDSRSAHPLTGSPQHVITKLQYVGRNRFDRLKTGIVRRLAVT